MNQTASLGRVVRFGAFEVDFEAQELRKRGVRLKLQDKPFQILARLLERPGSVVTREDLRRKLWPPDTHVLFDRSLNTGVNKLREALGDSAAHPRFIETLARRGYRFVAPVETAGVASSLPDRDFVDSIAVLPFENLGGDPEMEYLSDGITESLIHNLSQLPEVRVMARSTVFCYKGRGVDPRSVGRELSIRAVLLGRVAQRGDVLSIGTELVDVDKGWRLWGAQYNRKLSDILAVQEEISREISENLRLRLSGEQKKRLVKRYTGNAEAYRDYLRGRFSMNKMTEEGLKKSVEYYEQAIAKDPDYALAYAGLADSHGMFAFFGLVASADAMPRAKAAATRALEIDEALAEAHVSLAGIKKAYEWDWRAAEAGFQRALELNPNDASAHHGYAALLSGVGRADEALREILKAQELDPLSLVFSMEVAWNLYMARQYEGAVEQSLKTLEMEPAFAAAHHTLGLAYQQLGKCPEAVRAFEKARDYSAGNPATLAGLGHACAVAGKKREATKILGDLKKLSQRGYVSPYWLAILGAALSGQDTAFKYLEAARQQRDVWLVWLKVEPRFDTLRSDPRFEELLRQVGFSIEAPTPDGFPPPGKGLRRRPESAR